ncbi:hypothetical protein FQN57_006309 [Myotisia sp. PD_48]|nr:hypothetical protein FQN57_006309 [Myotisia sp. PD_48]
MPVDEPAALKTVDSNRPKFVFSSSQQSIAASDDYYYSFDDATAHSNESKVTVVRYQTPPSRNPSPALKLSRSAAEIQAQQTMGSQYAPAQRVRTLRRVSTTDQTDDRSVDAGTPTPGVDDAPYIRFAIDQLTRDEELTGENRHGSVVSTEYPVDRIVPDEGLGYYSCTGSKTVIRDQPDGQEKRNLLAQSEDLPETLLAVEPPDDEYRYPSLNFTPFAIRPIFLCSGIVFCLGLNAALIFCNIWSQRQDGLWNYVYFGGSPYFVFEFLPQILGAAVVSWLFVVQSAIYRIGPLLAMDRLQSKNAALQRLSMLPKNFVFPDLAHFKHGDWLVGISLLVIWAVNWVSIPLHASLFIPRYYGSPETGGFRWTISLGVGWVLVALYCVLCCALVAVLFRFRTAQIGLQWDPVSLADIIPLIQRSNILHDFDQSEISPAVANHLQPQQLRLGYWRTSTQPQIFYALGEENAPLSRPLAATTHPIEKPRQHSKQESVEIERQALHSKTSFERSLHSPFFRYRWVPWFLRDTFVVAWIVMAIVFLVAFIVVSFVKQHIQNGFVPLLPTRPSLSGFSSSNFLYSFVPALIGNLLFLAWQPIDVYFRAAQPYADLASPQGASAERSLLLSYSSCLPLETSIIALYTRHYKVAYISFISIFSLALPVLAGGVFMARFYPENNEIRISSYMPAFYTLLAFVIVYALSFLIIWPRRKRYLPHSIYTYADTISFLYQSPLLFDKVFREPRSKVDLITRAIVAPPGQHEKAMYSFGMYYGQDGKEHLGIDRLRRMDDMA